MLIFLCQNAVATLLLFLFVFADASGSCFRGELSTVRVTRRRTWRNGWRWFSGNWLVIVSLKCFTIPDFAGGVVGLSSVRGH